MALGKIFETGAIPVSLTADGPIAHLTMMRELRAKLCPDDMVPYFTFQNHRIHVLLDVAHMLKLVRNSLASEETLLSPSGPIQWSYVLQLQNIQESEGLHAGTKLRRRHIEWTKNKMKVCIAAQTLSRSVADAIDFCREDLRMDVFEYSKPTTEFIRVFDSLFDCFNSRSIFGKNFKAPLKKENYHNWISLFSECEAYINSLTKTTGEKVLTSRIRTGFLGFLCAIHTFQNLYQDLILHGQLDYLLSYKFSQDHLELFNGAIRASLGANNNPTCKKFEQIFKRLLIKLDLKSISGNCSKLDETALLSRSSHVSKINESSVVSENEDFLEMVKKDYLRFYF